MLGRLLRASAAGVLLLLGSDYANELYLKSRIRKSLRTPHKVANPFTPVPTLEGEDGAKWLLDPKHSVDQISLIDGDANIGKSALVKSIVSSTVGVRYVDVSEVDKKTKDKSLVMFNAMAKALNVNPHLVSYDGLPWILGLSDSETKFMRLHNLFREVSDQETNTWPIIVFDNISDATVNSLGDHISYTFCNGRYLRNCRGRYLYVGSGTELRKRMSSDVGNHFEETTLEVPKKDK